MNILAKYEQIKSIGFSTACIDFLYRYINRVTPFKVLQGMTLTLEDVDRQYLEEKPELVYRFLGEEELLHYAGDPANELEADFVVSALAKGDRCFGIVDNNNLASYGWYSNAFTSIDDELELCFDMSWTYMYKGFTKRDYRGQRLHAYGMAMALDAYVKEGKKGLVSYVEANNYRSLRSTVRLGYRNFGKVFLMRAFGGYRIFASTGCRPYAFTAKPVEGREGEHRGLTAPQAR